MSRAVVACFVTVLFAGLAQAEEPKAGSLKEFVHKNQTRHVVALYLQNKRVGWMVAELKLGTRDGKDVALESTEMLLQLSADGEKTTVKVKETTFYSLDGEGTIIEVVHQTTNDGKDTFHTARLADKGMTVTTKVGATETTRKVPLPKARLALSRQVMNWLTGAPAKGATFENWTTSWDEQEVDSKEIITYKEKKSITWGGIQTEVHVVTINMQGAIFDAELLSNGNPIRGKIGGILELRAETEEVAKKLDKGGVDMIAASSIKIDKNLGASPLVTGLTLEVVGLTELKIPQSHRQQVRSEKGKILLDLKKDFRVDKATPLTDADRKKFTEPTPTIQSDLERVRKQAVEIVGKETDTIKKAELLKNWVYRKIRKTMASNSSTTVGVLDSMAGDCTEHTLLFVSLARSLGIPARELTGVAHIDKIFGWHAWAEVHDGHQWISVDPTWNELYVDATHIVFSHDPQDHAWINVLGRVSFKAVKVEKDEKD